MDQAGVEIIENICFLAMHGEIFKENLSWNVFSTELDSGARVVEEF